MDLRERAMENEKASKKRKKEKEKKIAYSINGKVVKEKMTIGKKVVLGFVSVVVFIGCLIYIPPVFYHENVSDSYIPVAPDSAAIKTYQTYLKNHLDSDFDQDGLSNDLELERNTSIWDMDTDGDGVSDYAELFLTETSPVEATSIIVKQVMEDDKKKGETIGTPYKIDDIIFWPDDYTSKSYGGVVKTMQGYRFCNYTGWVKFPKKVYAYNYKNGIHYEMKYREAEDAYKISSSDEVYVYDEPLEFVHCLKIPFLDTFYLKDGRAGRFFTKLLPDFGGIVTCHKASTKDIHPSDQGNVTAQLKLPLIVNDESRFSVNTNTLKDLSTVRKHIEAGECIAASLYSGTVGEVVVIVYGYTEKGDLLVADRNLNPVGTIEIAENAKRMMDKEGTIGQISWFDWKGLGYDSKKYGDRINFFASTITSVEDEKLEEVPDINTVSETEPLTETSEGPSVESETEPLPVVSEQETELLNENGVETESSTQVEMTTETRAETQTELQTEVQTEIQTEAQTESKDAVITFGF